MIDRLGSRLIIIKIYNKNKGTENKIIKTKIPVFRKYEQIEKVPIEENTIEKI